MTASIKLFGGMSLQNDQGPLTGQIAQRRRLALLAMLAASRSPVSRDRLVGILWPELDAEGARHRLSDSIYVARRALGESAFETPGDDIWLDDAHLSVDVRAFERALDEGALEQAVALYAGPFLDGFHLSSAEEFERWVDEERARLSGRFAQALRTLATDAERRGDFAAAAKSLRRLAALDPLDARVTLRLMSALERAGDGAGALRQARVHQALRHAELGLGEDSEVRRASDELGARLESKPIASPHPTVTAPPDEKQSDVSSPSQVVRRTTRRVQVGVAAAVILVAIGGWAFATRKPSESTQPVATAQLGVAVFPFTDAGGSPQDVSGEAMAILLATKLDGGGLRSIDPNALLAQYRQGEGHPDPADAARLAHRLGASYFVLGDIVRATATVHLGAALYDAKNGEPVSARVGAQGVSEALFELVDSLATRLLVGRRDEPAPQLARLASVTTSSLAALKAYLAGEAEARAGHHAEAVAHLERAVNIDTTFALAYYRLAAASGWTSARSARPLDMAARYATRMPERFRMTLEALDARRRGDPEEAEKRFRAVIARYPDDFDATYELGDLLFHASPLRGRDAIEAREPLERAAMLEPTRSAEALYHLISIASLQRRRNDIDSLASRFLTLHPTGDLANFVRPTLALLRRDTLAVAQAARDLARLPLRGAVNTATVATQMAGELEAGARFIARLDDSTRAAADRATVFIAVARIAGALGDWRAADSLMNRAQRLDPPSAVDARARLMSLPFGTPPVSSVREARRALEELSEVQQPRGDLLAGLLALRLDDTVSAQATIDKVTALNPCERPVRELLAELRARRLLKQRRPSEALVVLENERVANGLPLRYLRAEVLEALGRKDDALRWYAVSEQNYSGELYVDAIDRARKRLNASR